MFKSKKKEETKSVVSKVGDTKTVTQQTNFERRLSENTVEHRSVTYTSTSYSSMKLTNSDFGKSFMSRTPINTTASLFDNPIRVPSTFGEKKLSIDAKPFSTSSLAPLNGGGYTSCFSRKLTPYSIDATPFNTSLQPPISSPRTTTVQSTPRSQVLPRNSSYNPETTPALSTAPSTQSLPTSNESSAQDDQRIPTYKTTGRNRGKVMIINNIKFLQEKQERKGAETDEKNIRSLFRDMGFDIETHRNLKKNVMIEKVKKFSNDSSLKRVDISVLIMMSHGSNVDDSGRVVQGGFTQIYGIDDVGLPIDEILDRFSAEKCPAMAGKPKIFIFQCCRGESEERNLHNDAAPLQKNVVKKHADMLIAFSTLPGFYSIRDTKQGSWYIQSICEIFKKHAKEFDVETLLKIVDDQLSRKHPKYQQTSSYESRGFKRCFLNPK